MKKNYLDRLKSGTLLFDGGIGTYLYSKGVFLNRCFEELCLSRPETVLEVHREYIEAGAQVLTTNSFGANRISLSRYGLEDRVEAINKAAVKLAREAAEKTDAYVAGSIGPLGQRIEPLGRISRDEARGVFKEQAQALSEAGVDLLLFETFKDIDELLIAVEVAKEVAADLPVQAQFSMDRTSGRDYAKEAQRLALQLDRNPHVDVVGVNCTMGPAGILDILLAIRGKVQKPLSIMPNAGYPREIDNRVLYLASPEYFAEYALRFLDGGAAVIGGCCGTTPGHIKKMGDAILPLSGGRRNIGLAPKQQIILKEEKPLALEERSALGKALVQKQWITSVELVPPVGTDLSIILKKSGKLKESGVQYINIPDGPRASSRIPALLTAQQIQEKTGIHTIPHICARDKNLLAIQSDLLGADAVGLRNLLFITGDPPKVGNNPDVTGVFDTDSIGLISLAARLNRGIDLDGGSMKTKTAFVIGAGLSPTSPVPDVEIERAYKKTEAGAEFFITQTVFDPEVLLAFLKKIEDIKVPIIAGVWPLASYKNAQFLRNEVPGVIIPDSVMERMERAGNQGKEQARAAGIEIAREIIDKIRVKVTGVQISPPFGQIQTALDVLVPDNI